MPIKVTCNSCRASFSARDDLAGKKVACPKCKQPLVIPAPADAGMGDLLDEIGLGSAAAGGGGRRCPSCGAQMPAHGVVCVECGYNVQTGRRVTRGGGGESEQTKEILRKAEQELKHAPEQQSSDAYGEGWMSYLIAIGALVIGAAGMALAIWFAYEASKEGASAWVSAARSMKWFGLALAFAAYVDIVVRTFLRSLLHGGLSIIPIYGYVYAIINSPNYLRPLFVLLVSWNFQLVAVVVLLLGFAIAAEAEFNFVLTVMLIAMEIVGLNLMYWGWVRNTGHAYEEEVGGITHGTLSLVVPWYAFIYGFYRGEQPYVRYAAFGVGGISLFIATRVTIVLLSNPS